MPSQLYSVQKKTLFSESLIWQLNSDFYNENGINVWSDEMVPHQITNSALAATAYAELIYAFLKDLALLGKIKDRVYILELGAGHGRLCYNILKQLEILVSLDTQQLPNYCYVLSDIVEENLLFLDHHSKLQPFFDNGTLDTAFFDATSSTELHLRNAETIIDDSLLEQPILAIGNYFFDSLPNELFHIKDRRIYDCSVAIDSIIDPTGRTAHEMIKDMELSFQESMSSSPVFENAIFNKILDQYLQLEGDSYVLFPKAALNCLSNISSLSKSGMVMLTMDKGYKDILELVGRSRPDVVRHGSFSLWVNFHAMAQYCLQLGGKAMFDSSTNLSLEFGCLFFTKREHHYPSLEHMYRKHTRQLNLDDLSSVKKLVYRNRSNVNLSELLALFRLSAYDASIFINLLPTVKNLAKNLSLKERSRLKQTIEHVWDQYYAVQNNYDFSYELGGLLYDLAYYREALAYFNSSLDLYGNKMDVLYNQILCYYQLREDVLFYKSLENAKQIFPMSDAILSLENLDMQ